MAAMLLLLVDALQGHGRCAAAIVGFAGSIAKLILATMNQITWKRLYQVMAVLGLVLLYVYITLAALFLSIPIVLAVSYAMQSPVVALYYLLCFSIMAYIAPEILCIVVLALGLHSDIFIPGTPLLWMCVGAILTFDPTRLIGAIGISTAAGLWCAPCLTMVTWLVLAIFAVVFAPYAIVCCIGAVAMLIYPWLVQKNYTLRWRRLLLYGGQSYRSIVLIFAWLFQARPLYIVFVFAGVWAISKLAITSPMKRQLDPIEILRDLRHGGSTINVPMPHVIFLSLCNLSMGASIWRIVLSGVTISAWYYKYHFQENYLSLIHI